MKMIENMLEFAAHRHQRERILLCASSRLSIDFFFCSTPCAPDANVIREHIADYRRCARQFFAQCLRGREFAER